MLFPVGLVCCRSRLVFFCAHFSITRKLAPSVLYPLLRRLTNEQYFETYLVESSEGPPRKYYHLTAKGVLYGNALYKEWDEFQTKVNEFFRGVEHE